VLAVTSAADTHQDGLLTLREAVALANADASGGQSDTITFDDSLGNATITLTAGPLELSGASSSATETVDGGGQITVNGNHAGRSFTVDFGVAAALDGLTIADGNATNSSGGGIYNAGVLTVRATTLQGNFATDGGGIYNGGTLTLTDSTLTGNSALYAGGIENYGTLTVSNSTLSGNVAASFGGSLWTSTSAAMTLTNVTVTANRANGAGLGGQGGGLFMDPGATAVPVLHNTLIAGNFNGASGSSADDVFGALDPSGDYNLIGDGTGLTGISNGVNGNQVGTRDNPIDPLLGPLGDYGGPTQTAPLLAGSPALDAGNPASAPPTDQRGVPRGPAPNIGAFEATAASLTVTGPTAVTAGQPFDVTVRAVDPFGQPAAGYTGTVDLTSTDGQAPFLGEHAFTLADGGQYTFTAVVLYTAGPQEVFASDGGGLSGAYDLLVQGAGPALNAGTHRDAPGPCRFERL
jgi:hypothetical protein